MAAMTELIHRSLRAMPSRTRGPPARGNLCLNRLIPGSAQAFGAGDAAGTYYFCSSDLHGWNASHTYCITSSKVNSGYSSEFVLAGTDADFSHVTQTGLAFAVNGTSGSFVVFGGDRWADFAGNDIGYNQWVPLTFNGTTPTFHSLSQWNVDPAAGT